MEKRGPKPEWKANRDTPLTNSRSKAGEFHNASKNPGKHGFPNTIIISAIIIFLGIIGLILFTMGLL